MCGGDDRSSRSKAEPEPKPQVSPVVQAMIDAVSRGPTGYSADIKKNLGMDARNFGFQGGTRPTSGMAAPTPGPFGYTPVPAQSDPLAPLLSGQKPSSAAGDVDINDILLGGGGGSEAPSSNAPRTYDSVEQANRAQPGPGRFVRLSNGKLVKNLL